MFLWEPGTERDRPSGVKAPMMNAQWSSSPCYHALPPDERPEHQHRDGAESLPGPAPNHACEEVVASISGRARPVTILDHSAAFDNQLHLLLSLGIVCVMVDCPGFASEFVPVLVTRVLEFDPRRHVDDLPSSNIMRGQGLLLKELVSARVCENPSLFATITFTFDGSLYLECDSPDQFVWLPSDGFNRTRAPWPRALTAEQCSLRATACEHFQAIFAAQQALEDGNRCDHCGCECEA